jgi:hypothetical protein
MTLAMTYYHVCCSPPHSMPSLQLLRYMSTNLTFRFLFRTCFFASIYNLVAITLEQYFEIVHPVFYKSHQSTFNAKRVIVMVWIVAISYDIAYAVPDTAIISGVCYTWGVFPNQVAALFIGWSY